jgi:hypothetical protein
MFRILLDNIIHTGVLLKINAIILKGIFKKTSFPRFIGKKEFLS